MSGFIALVATPVAAVLRAIHAVLSTFLAPGSGPAWGLSIVLLTVCVRLILFPLFVKQIKSQRRMQQLAPRVKELQAKHKGDRETLNTEMMKLYKDNDANPIAGCLPLVLQLPVFFALFSVIREFKPGATAKYGLTAHQLAEGGRAKVFGAPLSAAFKSGPDLLARLDGDATIVKIVATTMIVLMGATTFWTQRQMMARSGPAADATQAQVQKLMLYVLPFSFAIFGFGFPIGILLYWLTTNVWSMGQQAYVIKRMPPVKVGSPAPVRSAAPAKSEGLVSRMRTAVQQRIQTPAARGSSSLPLAGAAAPPVSMTKASAGSPPVSGSGAVGSSTGAKPPLPVGAGAAGSTRVAGGSAPPRGRQTGNRKNKRRRGGR